jgi:hypothetical protein
MEAQPLHNAGGTGGEGGGADKAKGRRKGHTRNPSGYLPEYTHARPPPQQMVNGGRFRDIAPANWDREATSQPPRSALIIITIIVVFIIITIIILIIVIISLFTLNLLITVIIYIILFTLGHRGDQSASKVKRMMYMMTVIRRFKVNREMMTMIKIMIVMMMKTTMIVMMMRADLGG